MYAMWQYGMAMGMGGAWSSDDGAAPSGLDLAETWTPFLSALAPLLALVPLTFLAAVLAFFSAAAAFSAFALFSIFITGFGGILLGSAAMSKRLWHRFRLLDVFVCRMKYF